MSDHQREFSHRLKRLTQRHHAMARGYTARLRGDGLIVVEPRRVHFKLPLRGFVLLMTFFMIFKGFMLASLGSADYSARLNVLEQGRIYEQAGAYIMGIDPVSDLIAQVLRPHLK